MFTDSIEKEYQLVNISMEKSLHLACGLFMRGDIIISDIKKNINLLKSKMVIPYWNPEGFKVGLCNYPPIGQQYSLLCLSNNTSIKEMFMRIEDKFNKLYKHKTYAFHYTKYGMEESHFGEASSNIHNLIQEYEKTEAYCDVKQKDIDSMRCKIIY